MPGASFESVEGDAFTGKVMIKLGPINPVPIVARLASSPTTPTYVPPVRPAARRDTPGPSPYQASLAALGQRKPPGRNQPLLVGRTEYHANRAEREFMASSLAL